MKEFIIGIDPDIKKSGVAIKNAVKRKFEVKNLTFFELFDFLHLHQANIRQVRVEASWLIKKAVWHGEGRGEGTAARVGMYTGANHEVGRKIIEMCIYIGIDAQEVMPLKKCWKGPDGKITHKEIAMMVQDLPKQTNQEQRDALLLIL